MTPRKYHNRPAVYDGIHFDSLAECRRYQELKQLEYVGDIANLRVHPVYEIQPAFRRGGKGERKITYEADFEYAEDGKAVVEDVKGGSGTQTAVFKLKRKLFLYKYPEIELRIVEKVGK